MTRIYVRLVLLIIIKLFEKRVCSTVVFVFIPRRMRLNLLCNIYTHKTDTAVAETVGSLEPHKQTNQTTLQGPSTLISCRLRSSSRSGLLYAIQLLCQRTATVPPYRVPPSTTYCECATCQNIFILLFRNADIPIFRLPNMRRYTMTKKIIAQICIL